MTASRSRRGCWGQPHLLLWDQICAASNISGHFLSSSVLFLQSSCSRINPDTEQRSSEETKLASYATPSSERGSITPRSDPQSHKGTKEWRDKNKNKNHWRTHRSKSLRIHRLQLLGPTDCSGLGRAQLKGAKELWSFTRIWVSPLRLPSVYVRERPAIKSDDVSVQMKGRQRGKEQKVISRQTLA